MVKNFGPLICITIMIMDVVAGILGIQAETAENQVKHLRVFIFDCHDPSYEAFKLGLASAVLLALAHVFANLLGGCICMCSGTDFKGATANKILAVCFLILSWVVLAAGFSLLMIGTLANSGSRQSCAISHRRFLSIGGILCFVHGFFSIAYYVSAVATVKEEMKTRQGGQSTQFIVNYS